MIVERLLAPLPGLLGAALAIVLAWLYLEDKPGVALAVVVGCFILIAALYFGGRQTFASSPRTAGLFLEAWLFVGILIAGIAGGVLIWFGVDQALALGDKPGEQAKALSAAAAAALTAYLGDALIKPEGGWGNPVKSAISREFAKTFEGRDDALGKDARSAVEEERYGAEAEEHVGDVVDGWGWDARRTRLRHIQDGLSR